MDDKVKRTLKAFEALSDTQKKEFLNRHAPQDRIVKRRDC
jgi:hypothetical protein